MNFFLRNQTFNKLLPPVFVSLRFELYGKNTIAVKSDNEEQALKYNPNTK